MKIRMHGKVKKNLRTKVLCLKKIVTILFNLFCDTNKSILNGFDWRNWSVLVQDNIPLDKWSNANGIHCWEYICPGWEETTLGKRGWKRCQRDWGKFGTWQYQKVLVSWYPDISDILITSRAVTVVYVVLLRF